MQRQKQKSLKLYHFVANLKLVLKKKEKVFIVNKNIEFSGLKTIINHFYDLGFIYGYRELDTCYEIYLNYYKNIAQIDEVNMLISLNHKQRIEPYLHAKFKNNYPRTTGFVRTKQGIIPLLDARKKKIGGQFLFYIR